MKDLSLYNLSDETSLKELQAEFEKEVLRSIYSVCDEYTAGGLDEKHVMKMMLVAIFNITESTKKWMLDHLVIDGVFIDMLKNRARDFNKDRIN